MAEKRYQLIKNFGDYHLTNGEKHICYDLCSPTMSKENWNNVVKELNGLYDENEQLKQRNEFLKKQLDRVCSENEIIGDKLKKI